MNKHSYEIVMNCMYVCASIIFLYVSIGGFRIYIFVENTRQLYFKRLTDSTFISFPVLAIIMIFLKFEMSILRKMKNCGFNDIKN